MRIIFLLLSSARPEVLPLSLSRRTNSSSGTSNIINFVTSVSIPFRNRSSAVACFLVRGKPSKIKPLAFGFSATLAFNILMVTLSGTKAPLSIYFFASKPSGVLFFRLNLNKSPVEMCTSLNFLTSFNAWVPFPEPGGPNKIKLIILLAIFGDEISPEKLDKKRNLYFINIPKVIPTRL